MILGCIETVFLTRYNDWIKSYVSLIYFEDVYATYLKQGYGYNLCQLRAYKGMLRWKNIRWTSGNEWFQKMIRWLSGPVGESRLVWEKC